MLSVLSIVRGVVVRRLWSVSWCSRAASLKPRAEEGNEGVRWDPVLGEDGGGVEEMKKVAEIHARWLGAGFDDGREEERIETDGMNEVDPDLDWQTFCDFHSKELSAAYTTLPLM